MKPFLLFLTLALLTACSSPVEESNPVTVHHRGALRNMMHQGDISAKADLQELQDREHLYALGALDALKGEILVWDGTPYIASASGGEVVIDHTFDRKATLLVYAEVSDWAQVAVPDTVDTYIALETFIAQAAAKKGLDTEAPFPFLLKGQPAMVDWHVIDWPEGDTEHTHEKHQRSGPHGTLQQGSMDILGFYSKHHTGVFTHHTTNMHLHFRTHDGRLVGHIDNLEPAGGMKLFLPVQ